MRRRSPSAPSAPAAFDGLGLPGFSAASYDATVAKGSQRRLILSIVATDSSFERVTLRGGEAWQGSCIHCRRRLLIGLQGEPLGAVTIEHILPRRHGGSDELANLALACARCNHQKGYRLDDRRADDPVLLRVIQTLRARRIARWRDPR